MRTNIRFFGAVALGLILAFSVGAAEPSLPPEAQALAQKAAGLSAYSASFTLETTEEDGQPFKLEGQMLYEKPNRRRLEIRQGASPQNLQVLISDGTTEWQYYPANNMVYRLTNPPEAPGPHRPFAEAKEGSVKFIEKLPGPEALIRFEAEPSPTVTEGAPVPIAKMQVDLAESDGLARRMTLVGPKGELVLTQQFLEVKVNPTIAQDQFAFTIPEGVTVTDLPAVATEPTAGGSQS